MASPGGVAGGAASGAAAGAMGGPVGIAVGAGIGALGSIFGGKQQSKAATKSAQIQSDAALRAAQLQAQGTDKALAFEREQAARDQANYEAAQRGNYDLNAARERRLGSLGAMLGFGGREIPAYVSSQQGGQSPQGGNLPPADLQAVYQGVRAKGAPTANSLDDLAAAYAAKGYKVDRPMYDGVPSKNELLVNGQKLKFTVGDVGQPNTGWYEWGTNDMGGAPSARPMALGAMLQPRRAPMTAPLSAPDPYTLAAYLWR